MRATFWPAHPISLIFTESRSRLELVQGQSLTVPDVAIVPDVATVPDVAIVHHEDCGHML